MSVVTARSVDEAFRASQVLTGKSDAINDQTFTLRPARSNLMVISPRQHLKLHGRKLSEAEILYEMDRRNYDPGHLLELLLIAGDREKWDRYTSIWALGQMGEQTINGKPSLFYPKLWGNGNFHDLGITSIDTTWSDSDLFVAARV